MAVSIKAVESKMESYQPVNTKNGKPLQLAMQRLWLTGKVLPIGAHLFVQHQFRNAESKEIEAIYTFALPREAALRRFVLRGEHFEVTSERKPVEQARKTYEDAIDAGHLAAWIQPHQDSLTTLSLGNLRPGETVTVTLELLAGVESHDDRARLRFPFTLAPAYHREARVIECPDGAGELELPTDRFGDLILPRWFRDADALHAVGFSLELHGAAADPQSPSHSVKTQQSELARVVSLRADGDVPDRDLILDVPLADAEPRAWSGELPGQGKASARPHWIARIPSATFGEAKPAPLRLVFVMDCSGSMDGLPLEQAKVALKASLGCLEPEDHFGMIAFGSYLQAWNEEPRKATPDAIRRARLWVDALETMGGTEILPPMREAMRMLDGSGSVLLMTDGEVLGQAEILEMLAGQEVAVHCLGIGDASQDAFLARIAEVTQATARYVSARERVDEQAMELFAETRERLATGVSVETSGTVHHVASRNVYAGRPLLIYGEGAASPLALELRWQSAGEAVARAFTLPTEAVGESAALLVGAKRIDAITAREPAPGVAGGREKERMERALVALSTEYGLASRAMALVAVHQRADDVAGGVPQTTVVPVGMPRDKRFGAYFGGQPGIAQLPRVSARRTMMGFPASFESADDLAVPAPSPVLPTAFSLPRLRRQDRKSAPPAPVAGQSEGFPASSDSLPALAASFEPDGGLPGADINDRARRTLAAVLLFRLAGNTRRQGPYRLLIARGLRFLRSAIPQLGSAGRIVEARLGSIEALEVIAGGEALPFSPEQIESITWEELERVAAG